MKAKVYLENGWYGEHDAGWNDLVKPLIEELAAYDGDIQQIKEKFGGLRFYYYGGPIEGFRKKVDEAEKLSYKILYKAVGLYALAIAPGGSCQGVWQFHLKLLK